MLRCNSLLLDLIEHLTRSRSVGKDVGGSSELRSVNLVVVAFPVNPGPANGAGLGDILNHGKNHVRRILKIHGETDRGLPARIVKCILNPLSGSGYGE